MQDPNSFSNFIGELLDDYLLKDKGQRRKSFFLNKNNNNKENNNKNCC